jgi:hypothetical protein
MFRSRRFVKPVLALIAIGAVGLVVGGCALVKPGSVAVSQPAGIGSARVHFTFCTVGGSDFCGPNEDDETLQYLIGIAVPPGSAPPASFTAVPIGAGAPLVFTRNDEVAAEMSASSVTLQKALEEAETPEEKAEAEAIKKLVGNVWPPSGLQGVGYLSTTSQEVKGQAVEWSVDADFGIPTPADGSPFPGPFATAIAEGFRIVAAGQSAARPVHCVRFEGTTSVQESESICLGGAPQVQAGTSDLKVSAPAKPAQAFVGGSGEVSFPLKFAGTAATVPTFALSATTTAKGGKTKLKSGSFTPGAPNPSTHLSPTTPGKVTVSLPRNIKPKTYTVTLTATTPQGGVATGVAKLKVTKPKLKFGAVQIDAGKGIATLKVTVPGAGKLTIAGKGVAKVKKKAKKKKTLKVKISPTGSASAQLGSSGSVKLKVKATFKPTSGISVSKTKPIVLKLR